MAATVRLKNVSPLGDLDFPLLRRVVAAGEEFEVPADVAEGLLEQVGNFERADKPTTKKGD